MIEKAPVEIVGRQRVLVLPAYCKGWTEFINGQTKYKDITRVIWYVEQRDEWCVQVPAVKENDYSIVNLNFGFNIKTKHVKFLPFSGINNVFNTKYNDNIRINAFGGRYYEPAPEFNMYGGVRVIF